jgi:hypothetical protein
MPYGIIKVETITFTDGGVDKSVQISGLVQNPTFSGNVTCTGTISGVTITGSVAQFTTITGSAAGFTTVTGTTVTGTTANFVSGVFTTQISGATITGNTGQFTNLTGQSAGFTTVTGTTITGATINAVSGVFTSRISGATITGNTAGFTTVTGTTITGSTVNAVSGVFTTSVSGATLIGNLVTCNSGNFASGLITTGVIQSTTGGFRFPDGTTQTSAATTTANVATTTGINTFSAAQRGTIIIQSYATGIALDFSSGNYFQITLTGTTVLQNPTNVASGQAGVVTIIQGSSGNTMSFGSNWHYPGGSGNTPSLTTTSGAVDLLVYYTRSTTSIGYRLIQDIKA